MSKKVIKGLRTLAESSPEAGVVLGWLSSYTNHAVEITVSHAVNSAGKWVRDHSDAGIQMEQPDRSGVIRTMKELEDLGLGRFWTGRRGAESRFEFYYNRGQIGKAARGLSDDLVVEEEPLELEEEEIIDLHRQLVASAVGKPISSVKIKVK